MRRLALYWIIFWALIVCVLKCSGQQITTVRVNPSRDTTEIKFTATTVTTTSYQVRTIITRDTTAPAPGYQLIFTSGYDIAADLDPDNQGQAGNGYIDNVLFFSGSGSFKSRPASVSSGIRSEVSYAKHNFPPEGAIEYDVIYNFIITDGCHSLQWHPGTDNGSAVLSLFHTAGKFDVTLSRNGTNYRQSNTTQPMRTILTGHWYRMRCEYKFANSGAYCRWFIDGSLYYNAPQTFLGDGSGQYLKVGFNGGFWGSQDARLSDINYDNLKIYKKV